MTSTDPATEAEVAPAEAPAPPPEELHGALVTRSRGQRVAHPSRQQLVAMVRKLRDEGWVSCIDLAGVDYLAHRRSDLPEGIEPERFEVVIQLISHRDRDRLRLRVQVPEADPVVPSLFEVHPGTEAMEREVFDLFGISFDGHPDLTRILLPEDWQGHPLRKDEAIGRIPVQFKDAPSR